MTGAVRELLRRLRLVPLIVMDDPGRADALGRALVEGGLPVAEIAFRTPHATEALRRMAAAHPELVVGAGTVLTAEQAAAARSAGAQFIVSPGLQARVVDWCLANGVEVFPGVCTPTEIGAALERGLSALKFFPAEPMGGVKYLDAVAGPFPTVAFIPTGGVSPDNLAGYLAHARVLACGGSWMAPRAWIEAGAFDRIRDAVRAAVRLAHPPAEG